MTFSPALLRASVALPLFLLTGAAAAQPAPPPPPGYDTPPAPAYPPPGYAQPGYPPPGYGYAQPAYPPAYFAPLPPPKERYSTPLMVTGIAVTSLGTVSLVASSVVYWLQEQVVCDGGGGFTNESSTCVRHGPEAAFMVGGALGIAAGIPMIVFGARKVSAEPEPPSAVPAIRVGPTGGSLRWAF